MAAGTFRSYQGRGVLTYDSGETIECDFVATQECDDGIELTCRTIKPGIPAIWIINAGIGVVVGGTRSRSKSRPSGFTGVASDGVTIAMTGALLDVRATLSTGAPSEITYILTGDSRLECGSPDDRRASAFRFAVANLVFAPLSVSEGTGTVPLDVDGIEVTLRQAEDYKDREKALKRSRGVNFTSEIRVPAVIGFEAARRLASDVSDLCSLGKGTLINWICCDAVDGAGQCIYSYHYPALARPFGEGAPLIDPHTPLDLKLFIEECLPQYRTLCSTREFRTVIHASCEARGPGFLDTRSLVCVSLLEQILGKDAVEHGEVTLVEEHVFQAAIPRLRDEVADAVRRALPSANEDQVNQITNHVRGFNWSSPRGRLKRTAARLGFVIPRSEIEAILATRNDLVHRLQFHTEDKLGEYRRLVWVLDTLILGLLGYQGAYVDARNMRQTRVRGADPPERTARQV